MNAWKYGFPVLEIVEADESFINDNFVEKCFSRIVRSDAGRHNKTRSPFRTAQLKAQLGKYRIRVDISDTGKRESVPGADKLTHGFGLPLCDLELGKKGLFCRQGVLAD